MENRLNKKEIVDGFPLYTKSIGLEPEEADTSILGEYIADIAAFNIIDDEDLEILNDAEEEIRTKYNLSEPEVWDEYLNESKEVKREKMNGLFSENSIAEELFDDLKEAETFSADEWNNATSKEREAMVRPIIIKFYKANRNKIDDNWDDFMELLEYWNYHTEYKIFNDLSYDEILNVEESKKVEVKFKDKVKAIKKSLKKRDKRLSDETAQKSAERIAGSMIKNESIRDGWKPDIDLYTRQINEIANNLGISKNEIQKEGDSIKFRYNGKVYFAEPRAMYQVDVFDDNHNQIGWGVLTDNIKEEVFTDYITDNKFIYELVGGDKAGKYTKEQLDSLDIINGSTGENPGRRNELKNQPTLKGYFGPMWNGTKDGKAVIRYETQEVYDMLSESKKLQEIASRVPGTKVEKKPEVQYEYFDSEDIDNLGSEAELIYDIYEKLGIDVNETWDNVMYDMDNGYLKLATINGKRYIVYDDGETQAYCIGRASDNMPITIIGNIADDTEIMKPVKRDTAELDNIYNSLYGDQLNESYDEEDEFMFDKYNIRKSLAGYIKYVSDCINDKEVERWPVSFDEFFNNEYENGYYNEEDTKFLDRYSIDELYDMASEYNDYIIECEEIGEDIKIFNDFFKLDESKKLQEDEVIDPKQEEGKCPVCGSEDLEYGDTELEGNSYGYNWECNDCQSEGIEWYTMSYSETVSRTSEGNSTGYEEGICPECGSEIDYETSRPDGMNLAYEFVCSNCGCTGDEYYDLTFDEHEVTYNSSEDLELDESKKLQEDEVIDRPEDIAEEQNEEVEDEIEEDIEETTENKTILDLLEERIGQELEAGRLNAVLQSIFGMYNRTFILPTDLYNVDADEEQTLTVFDDGDEYNIYYDVIDIEGGLIKITGVEIL